MKKLFLPLFFLLAATVLWSCSGARRLNYVLTEQDASAAIRELLQLGTQRGGFGQAFSRQNIIATVFPKDVANVLNKLDQYGLSSDLDRFANTLSTAALTSAERSVPVFASAISGMRVADAIQIVRGSGTAATDFLRSQASVQLRQALTPVMQTALEEYKLNEQWGRIVSPLKNTPAGGRLNLDLSNLMAIAVSEAMFRKMAEQEQEIRNNPSARTSPLLRQVFGSR